MKELLLHAHLDVGGKLITNLRLSGETIMKIFTGQITNWDSPEITKDYGTQLPNLRIIPVIRSDGSGATYFFTRWMAHEFPSQWNNFCATVSHGRVKPPCGQTEFYPQFPGSVAQSALSLPASNIVRSRSTWRIAALYGTMFSFLFSLQRTNVELNSCASISCKPVMKE